MPRLGVGVTMCQCQLDWDYNARYIRVRLGVGGLAQFKNTLALVESKRFEDAAVAMLQSKWTKQTPNRAKRHAEQMRSGLWCSEYK